MTSEAGTHSSEPSAATAVGTTKTEVSSKVSAPAGPAPDAGAGSAKSAVSEKTGSGSAPAKREATTETPPKAKRRKGFWAQFVGACVPCMGTEDTFEDASPTAATKQQPQQPATATRNLATSASSEGSLNEKDKRRLSVLPPDASISTTLDVAQTTDAIPVRDPTPEPRTSGEEDMDTDADADVVVPPHANAHHTLPDSETGGVTAGAVQAPGQSEADIADDIDDDEDRLILNGGMGIPIGPDGQPQPLLPKLLPQHEGRKCLVLDLDETLVHSSFKMIPQADYVIPVLIEHQLHNVYVVKRPGVDHFLEEMGKIYEVVVFTASLSMYADPVLDKLDAHKSVTHRLFREHCYNHKGVYVKDLSQLGRPIESVLILDNSPASYIFHPNNAVPVSSWFSDPHDTELTDMCPFLDDLTAVEDVRGVLDGGL